MKKKDPALWAACRVHRILANAHCRLGANSIPLLATLLIEQKAVERGWRMYQKARCREWSHAADILLEQLVSDISRVNAASKITRPSRIAEVPTIADILAEIRQLHDEFDDVDVHAKDKRIDVRTEAITLKDVSLGEFCIQLHLDRLARRRDATAFAIVAKHANAASSDSSCTHPHVRGEALCAGEATTPISYALAEGRIGDAFQLINRVLHTYNPSSAYVSLDKWDGRTCTDCGRSISSDDLYSCEICDRDFCDNCVRNCEGCDQSVCLGCLEEDEDGDRLCPECHASAQEEPEDDDSDNDDPQEEDDPVPDPTDEEPQPPTETFHEHPHSSQVQSYGAELPSGTADGENGASSADISAPQAA